MPANKATTQSLSSSISFSRRSSFHYYVEIGDGKKSALLGSGPQEKKLLSHMQSLKGLMGSVCNEKRGKDENVREDLMLFFVPFHESCYPPAFRFA